MTSTPPFKKQKIFSCEENNVRSTHNINDCINSTNGMEANGEVSDVDEGLYSRQIYVFGMDGMRSMAVSNILLKGLNGPGPEIAKNLILAGVKSLTLHDVDPVEFSDLSTNCFVNEEDIGHPRAQACRMKLAELNSYVSVNVISRPKLDADDLKKFQVVVVAQADDDTCIDMGEICRGVGTKFVAVSTLGLYGKVFCDFGPKFVVQDTTGSDPPSVMVGHIDQSKEGTVLCLEESFHGFETGDYVTFAEVRGMTELNGTKRQVKVIGPHSFSIGDTSSYGQYISGGLCTQVKMPAQVTFDSYSDSFRNPNFLTTDYVKFDSPAQLHILFKAHSEYVKKHKCSPKSWNEEDATAFLQIAKRVSKDFMGTGATVEVDEKFASIFAFICAGQFPPVQSVIGGYGAQEVLKACFHKFMPTRQWAYFEFTDCLEPSALDGKCVPSEKDVAPTGSIFDPQIAIFGRKFQDKLRSLNLFLVGAGALGCEFLKNFALLGASTGSTGKITVTDMDSIERSNLNRQYLYRDSDTGMMKSVVAANAIKRINPEIKIVAHENRVGAETEHIYNEQFYEGLDVVVNALDNVESRLYMDHQCVYYRKPLLESGTLGLKGNVQVVVPFATESYSSSRDPPEKSIPTCTLKNFPNNNEHTIFWALNLFEEIFVNTTAAIDAYKQDKIGFLNQTSSVQGSQPLEMLDLLKTNLIDERPKSFEDCVIWARLQWQELFSNMIAQLLFNFPPDHLTTTGSEFWSGYKRCPHILEFDANDPTHMDFILSAANLRAHMFAIPPCTDLKEINDILKKVPIPPFKPKAGVRIDVTETESATKLTPTCDARRLSELRNLLSNAELEKVPTNSIKFEKDNDENFHMCFITSASNLRASNYSIPHTDRRTTKLIAGKITPAVVTITAMIASLATLQLIKLVHGCRSCADFRNYYLDLAQPFFSQYEPLAPAKSKYYDKEFSLWDRFELSGEMTLQGLIDHFKKLDLTVVMVSMGVTIIYAQFIGNTKCKERLTMRLPDLVQKVTGKKLPPHVRALALDLCCTDKDDNDVEVPYMRYALPQGD